MANFILVHGMFHGGWAWVRIADGLRALGHTVTAPDLAGCGSDPTPPGEVTLERWVDDIVGFLTQSEGKSVLVGHSRGGVVLSQVAERVPDRIAVSVYACALMLPDGMGPLQIEVLVAQQGMPPAPARVRPVPNATQTALLAPADAAEIFYGRGSVEDRDWAMPQLGAEPIRPLMQPLALTEARYGTVPRVYIETTQDETLPIGAQRAMLAATPVDKVYSLDNDHMINLLEVEAFVSILDEVAARYAGD